MWEWHSHDFITIDNEIIFFFSFFSLSFLFFFLLSLLVEPRFIYLTTLLYLHFHNYDFKALYKLHTTFLFWYFTSSVLGFHSAVSPDEFPYNHRNSTKTQFTKLKHINRLGKNGYSWKSRLCLYERPKCVLSTHSVCALETGNYITSTHLCICD